jgi:hypothetical protein
MTEEKKEIPPIREIHRCIYCKDTGFVFAKHTNQNLYVFKHRCVIGKEKKENFPYWDSHMASTYSPISNKG